MSLNRKDQLKHWNDFLKYIYVLKKERLDIYIGNKMTETEVHR